MPAIVGSHPPSSSSSKLTAPPGQPAPAKPRAAADNIGSFRASDEWEEALPTNLRNLLGEKLITDTQNWNICLVPVGCAPSGKPKLMILQILNYTLMCLIACR